MAISEGVTKTGNIMGGIASAIPTSFTGNTTKASKYIDSAADIASNFGPYGQMVAAGLKTVNLIGNELWGSNLNTQKINEDKAQLRQYGNDAATASSFDDLSATSQALNNMNIAGANYGTQGILSDAVDDVRKGMFEEQRMNQRNIGSSVDRLNTSNINNLMQSYAANGGLLPSPKERNYAQKILSSKNNFSLSKIKRAESILNKFNNGGFIYENNPLLNTKYINNGSTHEKNPLGGVPMGIAQDGQPNLVEEGEVIWNDYVFSKRNIIPDRYREALGIKGDISYADLAKKYLKEVEEMPNDKIAKTGADSQLSELMAIQEEDRIRKQQAKQRRDYNKQVKEFASGGPFGIINDKSLDLDTTINDNKFTRPQSVINPLIDTNIKGNTVLEPVYFRYREYPSKLNLNTNFKSSNITTNNNDTKKKKQWDSDQFKRLMEPIGSLASEIWNQLDPYKPQQVQPRAVRNVSFNPIGGYMTYNPFDREYYANQLRSQQAGTMDAIQNSSSPSKYAAMLAADYNAGNQLGALYRQGDEQNFRQRLGINQFNTGINQFNSQNQMQTSQANASIDAQNAQLALNAGQFNSQMDFRDKAARDAATSRNLQNIFSSLGSIGKENIGAKNVNKLALTPGSQEYTLLKNQYDSLGAMLGIGKDGGKLNSRKRG